MLRTSLSLVVTLSLSAIACTPVQAGVVIGGTRVVFPAGKRDVSVRIENKGEAPALVQVWIDDGDERSTPETARAPFAMTPPVFRIDPGRGHALRIVHVGDSPPLEREKLYWLNVLEIPPTPKDSDGANTLQFAFRHRVKLMHRPIDLPMAPGKAPSALRWSVLRNGAASQLRVANDSPYVVSFNDVSIAAGSAAKESVSLGGGMALPGTSTTFAIPAALRPGHGGEVRFATINDYGAIVPFTSPVEPVQERAVDD